jgi:thioredoxin-related protein
VKNLTLALASVLGFAVTISASAEPTWLTDYKKAQEEAKASNKLLLLDFTGSDWCPPCIMLRKDVFSTREFQDYATKNFVLLEIDFPRAKPQAHEVTVQNQKLAQHYGIEVFPSVIVLNSDGKKIGELVGYDPEGGRSGYMASLEKLRKE